MRIGIIGGSGYVGSELLRIAAFHPQVEVTMVTSRQSAGEYVFNVHPNLRGLTQLKFVPQDMAELQKTAT
jgi:LysW-gamma-L-alpha-aminoadipyl-6-phosphate/LysW-L-glutamyl-5-phosphate reductase